MLFKRRPREDEVAQQPQADASGGYQADGALKGELGLHHLWYLELCLREELARAGRADGIFSLACWRLNLLPGETPDPELLRKAAGLIAGRLRAYDVCARLDEERFVALLFDADQRNASTVAFRLKGDLQVQVSTAGRWQAGVATFPRDGVDGDSLIQTAFRRLDEDARAA
ncbi:MAG: diguanylate cyclase [Dehalococcoidia bacterium]